MRRAEGFTFDVEAVRASEGDSKEMSSSPDDEEDFAPEFGDDAASSRSRMPWQTSSMSCMSHLISFAHPSPNCGTDSSSALPVVAVDKKCVRLRQAAAIKCGG